MFVKLLSGSAIVAAALIAAAPAQAASFVFTNSGSTNTYGSAGNTFQLTSGGITVTASAWSTSYSTGQTSAAFLGRYAGSAGGLGVTNSAEGNGDNNRHTIDNLDGMDFVALQFSQAVSLNSLNKTNYKINGSTDGDYWVSYWNSAISSYVAGTNYASTSGVSNSAFSTVWLIGASRNDAARNDGFKLSVVNVTAQVPEPATWLMMIAGFGLVGASLRRRPVKVAHAA